MLSCGVALVCSELHLLVRCGGRLLGFMESFIMSAEYEEMEYEDYEHEVELDAVPSSLPSPKGRSPVRNLLQKHAGLRSPAACALFVPSKTTGGAACISSKLASFPGVKPSVSLGALAGSRPVSITTTTPSAGVAVDSLQGSSKSGLMQYTVADGIAPQDHAILCFVNERKADYFHLGEQFQNGGPVMLVARNIGAWQARSNTLSVLDATILCPLLNKRLEQELESVFVQQVASLGYGTQLYEVFEAVNINSILAQPICAACRSSKVMQEADIEGHYFSCSAAVQLIENEKVEGRVILRNRRSVLVILAGAIVDKVLGLPEPFKSLYARCVFEARKALAVTQQTGAFVLNHMGAVIDFTPDGRA